MFVPEGTVELGNDLITADITRASAEPMTFFLIIRQFVTFSSLYFGRCGDDLPTEELRRMWRFTLQSIMVSFTRRNRFLKQAYSQVNTNLSGTLYVGSTISEPSPIYVSVWKIKERVQRRNSSCLKRYNLNGNVQELLSWC